MSAPEPTTRFGRLERRGVLLGLSGAQLVLVGTAVAVAVAAVYSGGAGGLAMAAPVWGALLAVGTLSVGGRPVVGWLPLLATWRARRAAGLTSVVASARGAGAGEPAPLVVPGLAKPLELVDASSMGGVLIADRRAGTLTGVLRVGGAGFVLDEPAEQEAKVHGWGRVLAGVCQQPSVVRVQLLARSVPGGLAPARRWWRDHLTDTTNPVVTALAGMLDEGFVAPVRRETLLAVAVRAPRAGRRGGTAVDRVAAQLATATASLSGAELVAEGWLDRAGLARVVHASLDPAAAAHTEDAPVSLTTTVGAEEKWSFLITGTSSHATYWVNEWPRVASNPGFLEPLLLADAGTLSLVAEPLPTAKALREIRRAKVEHTADASQRLRLAQIEDESTRAEVADLERREAELVAGHQDLRFTGLITVAAPDEATLAERCTAMETAAAQAMCEVHRLVGQQGVAFLAAALPLARGVL
jgi:hypothetical protein